MFSSDSVQMNSYLGLLWERYSISLLHRPHLIAGPMSLQDTQMPGFDALQCTLHCTAVVPVKSARSDVTPVSTDSEQSSARLLRALQLVAAHGSVRWITHAWATAGINPHH